MISCFRRTAFGLRVVALAAALIAPAVAHAHGRLKSSAPAAKARLGVAPREIRLVFTEAPELTFTTAALLGPGGPVELGPVAPTPGERMGVAIPIRGALLAGPYTVNWQTAGADGHPVRGTYSFVLESNAAGLAAADAAASGPPAGGASSGEPGAAVPVRGRDSMPAAHHDPESMPMGGAFDAGSPAYVAVRWLQFTALLLVMGALAFNFTTLGFHDRSRGPDAPVVDGARLRAAGIGLAAAVAIVPIALARLYAQSYAMHGSGGALALERMSAMLGRTSWGVAWMIQIGGAALSMVGFSLARRSRPAGWALAALGGVTLAVTPALSGHAAAAPKWTSAAILADTIHVIGAGGWLGGLLLLVAAGIPAAMRLPETERGPAVADLVNAFSPTALLFAGAAGATGVFAGWLHMNAVSDLWRSDYGRTLLLKLGILSVVAGTGAYNWLRVRPALGDLEGARRIRRSASVELAVGVVVLAVTAVLVAMPTPMDASMANDPAMDHSGMDMSSAAPALAPAAPPR